MSTHIKGSLGIVTHYRTELQQIQYILYGCETSCLAEVTQCT